MQCNACNGSRATHRRMQTLRFVLRSPERVVWAEEGVVGAEVEVATGLRALLLLGYGRQDLKQNLSLLKTTPNKPFYFCKRSPIQSLVLIVRFQTSRTLSSDVSHSPGMEQEQTGGLSISYRQLSDGLIYQFITYKNRCQIF